MTTETTLEHFLEMRRLFAIVHRDDDFQRAVADCQRELAALRAQVDALKAEVARLRKEMEE